MRQTPFQSVGQQSFNQFNPFLNQMTSPPSQMNQFMQDYDQLTRPGEVAPKRPRSRELDMMNLLLIGSMNKGGKRSGLEGLDSLLGEPDQQQATNQKNVMQQSFIPKQPTSGGLAGFGQQLLGNFDPLSQFDGNMQYPNTMREYQQYQPSQSMQGQLQQSLPYQQPFQQPVPYQQQMPYQQPTEQPFTQIHPLLQPQFNPNLAISPPNQPMRNQERLLINGQMGVNLNQVTQQPSELQEKPNTRVIEYIMRQNEVLEKLTQNMAQTREKETKDEKSKLLSRMKQLEAQNAQDAFYNDMYDEVPPHLRQPQQFRPPPGYQYQPFYQQQNLYSQQFQSQPYPAKQQRSKQQQLQMLRLLKEMQLNKHKKVKQKKKLMDEVINDDEEVDSYTSEESDPEPRVVQKPRIMKPRPIPPPPPYDPLDDQQKLQRLKKQRGMANLKICFHRYSYVIWWYKYLKSVIRAKKEKAIKEIPEIQQKFADDTYGLYTRVLKTVVDQMINPKTNIQIVPKLKQKISPNQMKQNVTKLKEIVKQVFDGVTDNASESDITQNMIIYLEAISCEYGYLLDNQHLKFELNRLNFSYHGSLVNMNQNKQFMMIIASILLKVLLYRMLSKLHISIPGVKVTDQLKTNVKTLTSVVYEAFMLFLRGYTAVQPDNTKYLPVEAQIKEKKEICYTIETFEATEEETAKLEEAKKEKFDEPLLHPIYTNREMAEFFDGERYFVNQLQAMVEGWCEKVNSLVLAYRLEMSNKKKEEARLKKEQDIKILSIKRDQVNKILKTKKEQYLAISTEIKELEDKIAQNIENAKIARQQYDQMQQMRNQQAGGRRMQGSMGVPGGMGMPGMMGMQGNPQMYGGQQQF